MAVPSGVRTFLRPEQVLRDVGIEAGWHVVDFGCGAGYYLMPAARFVGRAGRVVGIDIVPTAVEAAKKNAQSAGVAGIVDVLRADLTRSGASGLPDGWADLILVGGILIHSDPIAILCEAARVIRPVTGSVVVIEWDQVATPIGPPVGQRIRRDAALAAAKSAGLEFVSSYTPTPYQYGLVLKRQVAGGTTKPDRRESLRLYA